jgi:hypothetical protein
MARVHSAKAALRGKHISYALKHLKTHITAWARRAEALLAAAYSRMAVSAGQLCANALTG